MLDFRFITSLVNTKLQDSLLMSALGLLRLCVSSDHHDLRSVADLPHTVRPSISCISLGHRRRSPLWWNTIRALVMTITDGDGMARLRSFRRPMYC